MIAIAFAVSADRGEKPIIKFDCGQKYPIEYQKSLEIGFYRSLSIG